MSREILGVCVLVGVAVVGVVVLGGMAAGTAGATEDTQNASLGAEISSFMQASSVEATDDVENGTFEAALNRAEDPDERRALIEARQQRLQERSEQLRAQHEGLGNASDVRNRSMATRVSVGAAGLERSANRTETIAARNGVDTEPLAEVRSNARNLRGPELAELARSIAGPPGGGPPVGNRTGPPDDNRTGPPDDNRTGPPDENRTGPPDGTQTETSSERAPGPSGPPADTTDGGETDARDAERGSTETDPEGTPNGGPPGTDTPARNGGGSDGTSPDHAPGQDDERDSPDSAGDAGGGPPDDPGR